GTPGRGSQPFDSGRLRRPQRDVDRRCKPRRRGAEGDRSGRPPGAADGGYDLVARLDRLPARRMGRRRNRGWLTEGTHAAARARVQCRRREGAEAERDKPVPAVLLGLARDDRREGRGVLSLYPRHKLALWPPRGDPDAARRRHGGGIRAPRWPRGGDPAYGAHLWTGHRLRRTAGVFELADGRDAAGGVRRGCFSQGDT